MNDDLISKEMTMKMLREYAEERFAGGQVELANGILKAVDYIKNNNIPTAYNVDKVVEQLEEAKYEDELYPCNLAVEIEEAKRIVKSGGIE